MIHPTGANVTISLAGETPLGVSHGLGHQTDGSAVERIRQGAVLGQFCGRVSLLSDYSLFRFQRYNRGNRPSVGVRDRNGDPRAPVVPQERGRCIATESIAGTPQPSHSPLLETNETGCPDQSDEAGIRLFDLVGGATGRAPCKGNGHPLQRRSNAASIASGRIFGSSSQAHPQREAQRSRTRRCQEAAGASKKKP